MLILLTNDDGIHGEGLKALAEELAQEYEIFVAAPDQERSASSHSITFLEPLKTFEVKPGWVAISGTSVDCVNLALNSLMKRKPDLVISGINRGANLGCDVFYSGTVAGAREAGIQGLPSFAISVERRNGEEMIYQPAAEFARRFVKFRSEHKYPARAFFNVNFPLLAGDKIKGVKFTSQGIRIYDSQVWEREDPRGNKYYWLNGDVCGGQQIPDSDIMAVQDGFISVTPLKLDFTDYDLLAQLRNPGPETFVLK
jgi:5'-nucleotidase